MPRNKLAQIREKIRLRQYDMTFHAMEEMAEGGLDILDIEQAVLNGYLAKIEKDDPRGTTYVIEGIGTDQVTPVGIVGRFASEERYLIITVYEVTEPKR